MLGAAGLVGSLAIGGKLAGQDADLPLEREAFYEVRADERDCAWPDCGGCWISAVNRPKTLCHDGETAPECYVVDLEGDGDATSPDLVKGLLATTNLPEHGPYGLLQLAGAWHGACDSTEPGWYGKVVDLGIVCITEPCYDIAHLMLNRRIVEPASDLDLTAVGDCVEGHDAAWQAFYRKGLLVRGVGEAYEVDGGADGFRLVVDEVFVPAW